MKGSPIQITADSVIGVSGKPVRVYFVEVVATAGGVGTLELRNGTAATDTRLKLVEAEAGAQKDQDYPAGLMFPDGLFADVGEFVSTATIWYEVVSRG